MDAKIAIAALNALAQETRLAVFRLLVKNAPNGLPAGAIARELGVPHNSLSSHLTILSAAGLLKSRRESRSIIYCVDFSGLRNLLWFLMHDCCQGDTEVCSPLIDAVLENCGTC